MVGVENLTRMRYDVAVEVVNHGANIMARKRTGEAKPVDAAAEKLRAVRLELPEDTHKLLRREAADRDLSLGETARQLVEEGLKKKGGAK
jgi:hypothetical protein